LSTTGRTASRDALVMPPIRTATLLSRISWVAYCVYSWLFDCVSNCTTRSFLPRTPLATFMSSIANFVASTIGSP
jgi:hypothetical protein